MFQKSSSISILKFSISINIYFIYLYLSIFGISSLFPYLICLYILFVVTNRMVLFEIDLLFLELNE